MNGTGDSYTTDINGISVQSAPGFAVRLGRRGSRSRPMRAAAPWFVAGLIVLTALWAAPVAIPV